MTGCRFCGQEHPEREIEWFGGLVSVPVCPNLPESWILIDDRIFEVPAS